MEEFLTPRCDKLIQLQQNARVSTAATTNFRDSRAFSNSIQTNLNLAFNKQTNKNSKKLFFEIKETLKRNQKEEWMKYKS